MIARYGKEWSWIFEKVTLGIITVLPYNMDKTGLNSEKTSNLVNLKRYFV